jgi:hypothetical protein
MNRSLTEGYYTLSKETPSLLLFTPPVRNRRMTALALAVFALITWGVAAYSWLRPVRDMPGFVFFLVTGLVLFLAGVFNLAVWTEIEFNAGQKAICKRRFAFGRIQVLGTLPFDQLKQIRLDKTYYEYQFTHLQLIGPSGRVWVVMPGYLIHHRGQKLRQKLLDFIQLVVEIQSSSNK